MSWSRAAVVALLVLVALGCGSDDHSSRGRVVADDRCDARRTTSTIPPTHDSTTTTAPALSGPVTAIGDSVMMDATPALQAAIPTIAIDAAESRSALPAPDILATLAAHGALGPAVVVGLGSNGGMSPRIVDEVLQIAARTACGDGHQPLPVLQLDAARQRDHPYDVRAGTRMLRRGLGRTRAGTSRMVRVRRRPHVDRWRRGRGVRAARARATVI